MALLVTMGWTALSFKMDTEKDVNDPHYTPCVLHEPSHLLCNIKRTHKGHSNLCGKTRSQITNYGDACLHNNWHRIDGVQTFVPSKVPVFRTANSRRKWIVMFYISWHLDTNKRMISTTGTVRGCDWSPSRVPSSHPAEENYFTLCFSWG
jgi:hypothetical protein